MKKKNKKKSILSEKDHNDVINLKKSLIDIKKMLNKAKEEAERIEEENKENENILIFKKD
jgi:hypothetical protein